MLRGWTSHTSNKLEDKTSNPNFKWQWHFYFLVNFISFHQVVPTLVTCQNYSAQTAYFECDAISIQNLQSYRGMMLKGKICGKKCTNIHDIGKF
jgi:hypothetical protein